MWTIGGADRLRFPRFPSKLEKRGNARLRPHTHRPRQQGELIIDDSKNHTRPAERTNGVHVKSVDTKSPIQACPTAWEQTGSQPMNTEKTNGEPTPPAITSFSPVRNGALSAQK